MILKKHTDNARAFTFRHEFETDSFESYSKGCSEA